MANERVGEIWINTRTVRIGHQVYPLANISRVQTVRVVWAGRSSTFYPIKEITVLVVLFAALASAAVALLPKIGIVEERTARQVAMVVAVLFGVRVAYLVGLFLYRLLFRRKRYALLVETAGTQYTALSGTDRAEVHRIEGEIVGAIENPPVREYSVQIHGDMVLGNQYKQNGSDSRMTINK